MSPQTKKGLIVVGIVGVAVYLFYKNYRKNQLLRDFALYRYKIYGGAIEGWNSNAKIVYKNTPKFVAKNVKALKNKEFSFTYDGKEYCSTQGKPIESLNCSTCTNYENKVKHCKALFDSADLYS